MIVTCGLVPQVQLSERGCFAYVLYMDVVQVVVVVVSYQITEEHIYVRRCISRSA
jgi:hypothetical protein